MKNWIVDNGHGTHGRAWVRDGASPAREDNARLIAAAPDLLAALQGLRFATAKCEGFIAKAALKTARAAILKAGGEL